MFAPVLSEVLQRHCTTAMFYKLQSKFDQPGPCCEPQSDIQNLRHVLNEMHGAHAKSVHQDVRHVCHTG